MRMTALYTANYLAAGTSTLIAAGVFKMDRLGGFHDWQVRSTSSFEMTGIGLTEQVAVRHRRMFYDHRRSTFYVSPTEKPKVDAARGWHCRL